MACRRPSSLACRCGGSAGVAAFAAHRLPVSSLGRGPEGYPKRGWTLDGEWRKGQIGLMKEGRQTECMKRQKFALPWRNFVKIAMGVPFGEGPKIGCHASSEFSYIFMIIKGILCILRAFLNEKSIARSCG